MSGETFSIPAHAEHYSVVLMKEADGAFLLQRRAKGRGMLYPGRIGLFGGRREGVETPEACAVREVAEECGVKLQPASLTLLARLLAFDERGSLSFGHIFIAEDLTRTEARAARRFRSPEGRAILLPRGATGRRARGLTSIALYALSAHADLERARTPSRTGLAAILRAPFA